MKNFKVIIFIIVMLLLISMVTFVFYGYERDVKNDTVIDNNLQDIYSLDSDEIKIYIENGDRFDSITIDNPEDIRILQKSVQFNLWKYSKADYNGIDKFYVVFNNNTTIALYEEIPYGRLGEGIPDELGNILNSTVYFDISSDFLLSIKQMIEKYSIK